MAKTVNTSGTGTLPVTGPGVQSSVDIDDTSVAAGDKIILTETKRVRDARGPFHAYISSVEDGVGFTAKSNRNQLPETLTFNYISVT